MYGSYTYVGKYPVQNERIVVYVVLKGKSELLIFQRWGSVELVYRNREYWYKGYGGKNTKAIKEYIINQLKHDKESEQLSFFELQDVLMGNK